MCLCTVLCTLDLMLRHTTTTNTKRHKPTFSKCAKSPCNPQNLPLPRNHFDSCLVKCCPQEEEVPAAQAQKAPHKSHAVNVAKLREAYRGRIEGPLFNKLLKVKPQPPVCRLSSGCKNLGQLTMYLELSKVLRAQKALPSRLKFHLNWRVPFAERRSTIVLWFALGWNAVVCSTGTLASRTHWA